jgi:uncharacterized protein (TIRG00374 family)
MFIAGRQLRLKTTSVLTTIVLERVFDLLTIVGLLGIALLLAPRSSPELAAAGYVGGAVAAAALVVSVVYVTWTDLLLGFLEKPFRLFPERIAAVLSAQAEHVASGMMALRNARRVATVLLMTVALWLVMAIGLYVSLRAIRIDVDPSAALIVLAFTFIGVTLPTTPGAVGTIQLSFALGLAPYGVAAGDAVAASIFWHVIAYGFVVAVGLVFFIRLGYSWGEIRHHASEVSRDSVGRLNPGTNSTDP